jgi:hypothetical protein
MWLHCEFHTARVLVCGRMMKTAFFLVLSAFWFSGCQAAALESVTWLVTEDVGPFQNYAFDEVRVSVLTIGQVPAEKKDTPECQSITCFTEFRAEAVSSASLPLRIDLTRAELGALFFEERVLVDASFFYRGVLVADAREY